MISVSNSLLTEYKVIHDMGSPVLYTMMKNTWYMFVKLSKRQYHDKLDSCQSQVELVL
jgi:hypothetical protein